MQWEAMITKILIGYQKIWEPETKEAKEINNIILKVINKSIVEEIEKNRSQSTVYSTSEYEF